MGHPTEISQILERQHAWAARANLEVDAQGRVARLEDNLYQPLHPDTRAEYDRAAGNELAGDMRSVRSSAALVCNFFDPWRGRDAGALGTACAGDPRASSVAFERTFPTGLRGTPPHLDVVLEGSPTGPVAIESKFTEPYGPSHNAFRASYFGKPEIWRGLANCESIARRIAAGDLRFERLGAAQLLKHTLGLARAHGPKGFELLYLWFEVPGEAAARHASEIAAFAGEIGEEIRFRALTYQELVGRLGATGAADPEHLAYLADRYGFEARRRRL